MRTIIANTNTYVLPDLLKDNQEAKKRWESIITGPVKENLNKPSACKKDEAGRLITYFRLDFKKWNESIDENAVNTISVVANLEPHEERAVE